MGKSVEEMAVKIGTQYKNKIGTIQIKLTII